MNADISQPVPGEAGPGAQAVPPEQQDVHRPLLRVDRTLGSEARRHILVPVDDTDVRSGEGRAVSRRAERTATVACRRRRQLG